MNSMPEPAADGGGLVSMRTIGAAFRRHRRILVACVVVGTLVGGAVHLVVPRRVSASEDLYLAQPPGTDTAVEVADDQSLLQTWAVADGAVRALHLDMTPTNFLKTYHSKAVSTAVVSLTLSAPTAQEAVTREEVLARTFLAFRAARYSQQVGAEVANLRVQATTLQREIARLSASVPTSSTSGASAGRIARALNRESSDTSALASVDSQMQQAQLGLRALVGGSEILDPAVATIPSPARVWAEDALAGLAGGLGLGLLGVLVAASLSDGLLWRDDVAAVLDAPVGASVGTSASRFLGRRAARVRRRRTAAYRRSTAYLRSQLTREAPVITIVPVGSRRTTAATAAVAGQLADSFLLEGRRVGIVDLTERRVLARALRLRGGDEVRRRSGTLVLLRDAPDGLTDREGPTWPAANATATNGTATNATATNGNGSNGNGTSATATNGTAGLSPAGPAHDVRIQLVEVDPSAGSDHLAPFASRAVVVLKAGAVSAVRLRAASVLLRRAGFAVRGSVLLDADSRDATTGGARRRRDDETRPGRLAVVGSDR